jgi:cytochrome c551/c552
MAQDRLDPEMDFSPEVNGWKKRILLSAIMTACVWPGFIVSAVVVICCAAKAPEPMAAEERKEVTYANDVQPILAISCVGCHNARKKKAGVDVSSYETVQKIVKAQKPEESTLFKCISGAEGVKPMPPRIPLTEDKVATIRSWISAGAKEK